ncbi:LamG domain-containing protein [Sorangium sp. So ce233]|uniref:LamG domain-containing protein n=1 Tax=Sorangium sp. So ce233 TaxID=3133290 RepID=UPI003F5EC197
MTVPTPKHYWKFDESSGTTARDSVGDATISLDRASWVVGRSGNAIRFDPDDGVKLATTDLPEMPAPWTAAFWVYRWAASGSAALFSSNNDALKLQQWKTPEEVGITIFGDKDYSFGVVVPLTEWTHVTLVGASTETRLYLNGVLKGTLPVPIKLGLYWLGSTQGYEEFAKALFDEVEVWDVALTDDQVGEVANGGTQPVKPPQPITPIIPLDGVWYSQNLVYPGTIITVTVSGNNVDGTIHASGAHQRATIVSPTELNGAMSATLSANPDTITWHDPVKGRIWIWMRTPPQQPVPPPPPPPTTVFPLAGTYNYVYGDGRNFKLIITHTGDTTVRIDFTSFNPASVYSGVIVSTNQLRITFNDGTTTMATLSANPDKIYVQQGRTTPTMTWTKIS